MTGMDVARELPDFDPSTGHEHGCSGRGCSCAGHLYAIAQDAEIVLADREARLAAVEKVLADEPPLLRQIRADLGEGFPNELSERRGRTITGWVDRLRAAALHPDPSEPAQGGDER